MTDLRINHKPLGQSFDFQNPELIGIKHFDAREDIRPIRVVRMRANAYPRTCQTEKGTMYDRWRWEREIREKFRGNGKVRKS
jgi:hypothetical protein